MRTLLIFILLLSTITVYSQQNSKVVTNSEPAYVGGDDALYTYMYFNLKFSEEAKSKNITGDVTISFDVKTDSTTTNIIILNGLGYGIDEEIKKIISILKFIPAKQNGIPVRMNTMYTFPVKAH